MKEAMPPLAAAAAPVAATAPTTPTPGHQAQGQQPAGPTVLPGPVLLGTEEPEPLAELPAIVLKDPTRRVVQRPEQHFATQQKLPRPLRPQLP
jgi:hypothetical protein